MNVTVRGYLVTLLVDLQSGIWKW